jgi:hypothetical protein
MDVWDHNDDPASIVPAVEDMANRGVRTLYLETSRYASDHDIDYPNAYGAALDVAKSRGMSVVAWYPPGFGDLERDVRRTMAAINFVSPGGHRFDAFGADIEVTAEVRDNAERNRRVIEYSEIVRSQVGAGYVLAAIVIPPSQVEQSVEEGWNWWDVYPYEELAPYYQMFMPMNYWTGVGTDPETARSKTERNVAETRSRTDRPVHIIGGLANRMDVEQTRAFVDAGRAAGAIGGSVYDYRITPEEIWPELRRFNE